VFKLELPVITDLRNPFLKQRHWRKVEDILGAEIPKDGSFTMGWLVEQVGVAVWGSARVCLCVCVCVA
jgi:hypothetical protein